MRTCFVQKFLIWYSTKSIIYHIKREYEYKSKPGTFERIKILRAEGETLKKILFTVELENSETNGTKAGFGVEAKFN